MPDTDHLRIRIRLLASLAGLLHDLGKATVAFQLRLRGHYKDANVYRHEWASLRLWQAFVGADDDAAWLSRLARGDWTEQDWTASGRYFKDGIDAPDPFPFRHLPPLAAIVGWLVVTHHRLPVAPVTDPSGTQLRLGTRHRGDVRPWLSDPFAALRSDWNNLRREADPKETALFWDLAGVLPVMGHDWRTAAVDIAQSMIEAKLAVGAEHLTEPLTAHLSRLALMLSDHHYSSLGSASVQRVLADGDRRLYANTDMTGRLNQGLGEHLNGVGRGAGIIADMLPGLRSRFGGLPRCAILDNAPDKPRFMWQEKAFLRAFDISRDHPAAGAFVVNMASTGCGKTLGNARIMHGLAGAGGSTRITYTTGLRSLTLQTGAACRELLGLGDDAITTVVGGSDNPVLRAYHDDLAAATGSASRAPLVDTDTFLDGSGAGNIPAGLVEYTCHDSRINKIIGAPILVSTVDTIVPATDSLRGGHHIAPMLRLMSSDLVLDEVDDYGLTDLPAITRLVHWAGLLGARVAVSSATLPPSMVLGLFMAYRSGRQLRHAGLGLPGRCAAIPCLWVDENAVQSRLHSDPARFSKEHSAFAQERSQRLSGAPAFRRAALHPVPVSGWTQADVRKLAASVVSACLSLHGDNNTRDPATGTAASFGLVRLSNVNPLVDLAQQAVALDAPDGFCIHWCVYHSRFPGLQRSAIEGMLDAAFDRRDGSASVFALPSVRAAIDANPGCEHLFIVLASPVCEVGRDWDADWAVAELSSMRSIIQIAGRVNRHRRRSIRKPNIAILDTPLRPLRFPNAKGGVFVRPGYESPDNPRFRLRSFNAADVLHRCEYDPITSIPRISRQSKVLDPRVFLSDLEHARTGDVMLPHGCIPPARDAAWAGWKFSRAFLTGILPQQQPFRYSTNETTTLCFLPGRGSDLAVHRIDKTPGGKGVYVPAMTQITPIPVRFGQSSFAWGSFDITPLTAAAVRKTGMTLEACCKALTTVEVSGSAMDSWRYHSFLGFSDD